MCQSTTRPDGGYGWVVAVAGMLTMVVNGSLYHSYGIFLVEFVDYFEQGVEKIAWIGAIAGALCDILGPVAAIMTKKFGSRIVVMVGGSLCSIGMFASVFVTSVYVLYFTFGIMIGLGMGMQVVATILLISQYFDKKYPIAIGLFYAGVSMGVLVTPPLYHFLLNMYGWRGALLIIGAINSNNVVFGALMKPLGTTRMKKRECSINTDVAEDSFVECHSIHSVSESSGVCPPTEHQDEIISTERCDIGDIEEKHNSPKAISAGTHNNKRQTPTSIAAYLGLHLFVTKPSFSIICIAQFLEGFGNSSALSHLIARAVTTGTSTFDATLLLTAFGCSGLFGRLLIGYVVWLKIASAIILLGASITVYGLAILVNPLTDIYGVLVMLACVLGFSQGAYQALVPIGLRECVGEKDLGVAVGWDYFFMGVGYLLGPPFSGWLFDTTGNYTAAFFITGAMVIVGGVLIIVSPYADSCKCKIRQQLTHEVKDATVEL